MKVLLTIKNITSVGGAEKALVQLANNMYKRGYEVLILDIYENPLKNQKPYYELSENIKINYIYHLLESNCKKNTNNIITNIKSIVINNFHGKIKNIIIWLKSNLETNKRKKWNNKNNIKINKIREYILSASPDVVVSFMPTSFTYVAQALKDEKIPFIAAIRSDPSKDFSIYKYSSNKYDVKMRKETLSISDANIVFVEEFLDFFTDKIKRKTYVIPNIVKAVDKKEYSRQKNNKKKNIIYAARYIALKNHKLLIHAFALLKDKYPEWQLKLFGADDGEKKYLEKIVEKYNLSKNVFLNDAVKNINKEYADSDILAFPSVYEGFGQGLTEGMSFGLPCVVLKKCIPPARFVKEGNTGLLSDNNPKDFAAKLEILMKDPELRKKYGKNGQKYIEKYNPETVYDKWEYVINKVFENK